MQKINLVSQYLHTFSLMSIFCAMLNMHFGALQYVSLINLKWNISYFIF